MATFYEHRDFFGPVGGTDYNLNTQTDNKTVKLNSRNYDQTSGSSIGFQVKPAQNTGSSGNVIGGEISPRVNSGVALSGTGSVIGLHVDAYLKGTAAGTIAGDVRGMQIELVTDDAGTRTVSGDVSGLRFRSAFSATTITGKFCPIKIEVPETQTNSKNYDAVMQLTSLLSGVWSDAAVTSATAAGFIKVLVNGSARYINLFSGTPA